MTIEKRIDKIFFIFSITLFCFFILSFDKSMAISSPTDRMSGIVATIQPCNTGVLLTTANGVPGFWMDLPISIYGYKTAKHPGQSMVGKATGLVEPCILGVVPMGAGNRILFSSTGI